MKTVIITGISRGIGYHTTKELLKEGVRVIAITRNTKTLTKLTEKYTNQLQVLSYDLSDKTVFYKIKQEIANRQLVIDAIIHNAGALVRKKIEDTTYEDFEYIYRVNVFAVFELTRVLLPYFNNTFGHIVIISSMGGIQGSQKFEELVAYSSSKGAVITLSEVLAEACKEKNISVNTLALGSVQTEMLKEAFGDYKASHSPYEIGKYIADFTLHQGKLFNGKIIEISNSTP